MVQILLSTDGYKILPNYILNEIFNDIIDQVFGYRIKSNGSMKLKKSNGSMKLKKSNGSIKLKKSNGSIKLKK